MNVNRKAPHLIAEKCTTLTTDGNGYQVGSTQRYELYGEPWTPVLTSTDRLYTGQVLDSATGVVLLWGAVL
jgi:hypothetical protein